jgi:hypothetical protein
MKYPKVKLDNKFISSKVSVRSRPTPPSFNKTPAKIIDPKVGAST